MFSAAERMKALEEIIVSGTLLDQLMISNVFTAVSDTVEVTMHGMELGGEKVLMVPPFHFKYLLTDGVVTSDRHINRRAKRNGLIQWIPNTTKQYGKLEHTGAIY